MGITTTEQILKAAEKPLPLTVERQLFPVEGDYRPMVYFPSPYVRMSFLHELRYNAELRVAVNRAHKSLTAKAVCFAAEVFARVFSPKTLKVSPVKPVYAWANAFHTQLDAVQAFKRYQRMYAGDALGAALAVQHLLDGLVDDLPEEATRQPDPDAVGGGNGATDGDADGNGGLDGLDDEYGEEDEDDAVDAIQRAQDALANRQPPVPPPTLQQQAAAAGQELAQAISMRGFNKGIRDALDGAAALLKGQAELLEGCGIAGDGTFTGDPNQRVAPATKLAIAHRLKDNRRLREIARLAGRFRLMASQKQRGAKSKGPKDMAGLEYGNDLSLVLSSDMVYLGDPDTEALFDKAYVEKRLLQYKLENTPPMGRGPIIFCIDSSGSMEGDRDLWAKALFAGVAELALKQKRWCYAISFNARIIREDKFNPRHVDPMQFLDCLGAYVGGGTDYNPPLRRALDIIAGEAEFKKADVVFLTDGEAELNGETLARLRDTQTKTPVSVQGILVGNDCYGHVLRGFCDNVLTLPDVLTGAVDVANKLYENLAAT